MPKKKSVEKHYGKAGRPRPKPKESDKGDVIKERMNLEKRLKRPKLPSNIRPSGPIGERLMLDKKMKAKKKR